MSNTKSKLDNSNIVDVISKSNKKYSPMSIKDDDPDRIKRKAEIYNRLLELKNKQGIPKFNSVEEMEILINDFFDNCGVYNIRPTITGLSSALGVTYKRLLEWESGSRDGTLGNACSDIVKKAKDFIHELDEQYALAGLDSETLYIFRGKNYYGMQDKQDITITPNQQLDAGQTPDEIAKLIESDIPIDVDEL